jgi:CheY-like chemotaxis protein
MRKGFMMFTATLIAMSRASPFFRIYKRDECNMRLRFPSSKRNNERLTRMATWKTDVDTIPLHTVLIASDQAENISSLETLFQQRNCIVLSETTVANALQTARLVGPSLMLVDMKLSKAARNSMLRELRVASRGPILLLTTANTVDEVMEANQAGADECLVKPINPAVLVVKAMAWLGHGQRKPSVTGPLSVSPAM